MTAHPTVSSEPIGWVDEPQSEGIVGPEIRVTGWALAASGINRVEIRLAGASFTARYGLPRHDVADVRPGYADNPNGGFEFAGSLASCVAPANVDRRHLAIVAIANDGRQTLLGERTLVEVTHGSRTSDPSVLAASICTKARKVLAPNTIRCRVPNRAKRWSSNSGRASRSGL